MTPWLLALAAAGLAAAGPASTQPGGHERYAAAGHAALQLTREQMYLPAQQLYVQDIHPGDSRYQPLPADCWSSGVQLTALTAAARLEPDTYTPWLREYVHALVGAYWCDANGIGGFDSAPHATKPNRFYDDNAWIVLGLVEAYEVTHDPSDLEQARAALRFVLSGEDQTLGGGLYWQEQKRTVKNTCSSAPGVAATLRVYRYTHDASQLATAVRLYRWTVQHLRDNQDGLYFDGILPDGTLHRRKWSYNTALMIRSGCLLYDATGEPQYLHDAQQSAAGAVKLWVNADTGAIHDPSYFAHLLAEAFLELGARDHDPRWAAIDRRALDCVLADDRNPAGFYPEWWGERHADAPTVDRLINQASAARAFFRAARSDVDMSGPSSD